jgi:hypothetical protein
VYRPVLRLLQPLPAGADPAAARALDGGPVQYSWAELTGAVSGMLPAATWAAISPQLYITFWSLSLSDLGVPKAAYEERCERARSAIAAPVFQGLRVCGVPRSARVRSAGSDDEQGLAARPLCTSAGARRAPPLPGALPAARASTLLDPMRMQQRSNNQKQRHGRRRRATSESVSLE